MVSEGSGIHPVKMDPRFCLLLHKMGTKVGTDIRFLDGGPVDKCQPLWYDMSAVGWQGRGSKGEAGWAKDC